MVIFYKTELNKVKSGGEFSSGVFSNLVRINLRKMGILVYISKKSKYIKTLPTIHTRTLYPSCLASMILSGLFDEYDFME